MGGMEVSAKGRVHTLLVDMPNPVVKFPEAHNFRVRKLFTERGPFIVVCIDKDVEVGVGAGRFVGQRGAFEILLNLKHTHGCG